MSQKRSQFKNRTLENEDFFDSDDHIVNELDNEKMLELDTDDVPNSENIKFSKEETSKLEEDLDRLDYSEKKKYMENQKEIDNLDEEEYLDEEDLDEDLDEEYLDDEDLDDEDLDEDIEYSILDDNEEVQHTKGTWKKPLLIASGSFVGIVLLLYIVGTFYFSSHFYFNTKINGTDFSRNTHVEVASYMKDHVKGYKLEILESSGTIETITGDSISLEYKENEEIEKLLKKQNAFLWPQSIFRKTNITSAIAVNYDEARLKEVIVGLNCMKAENQVPSTNAQPVFNEGTGSYDITPEVYGTQVNQEVFITEVTKHVVGFETKLDIQKSNAYMEPKFNKESPEVIKAKDTMNTYVHGIVTYDMGGGTVESVTAPMIASWLTLGENMEVGINTDAINAYVVDLDARYSTIGATRTITTPTGKTAEVSGGTYGWSLDNQGEIDTLVANIQAGQPVTREPLYAQVGRSRGANDWGNSYVEVDLSAQYMWYVVNGAVVFETAVVTGVPIPEKITPAGVFTLLAKSQNEILKGNIMPNGKREYETPVDYWMRVTWSGIGFHDANWQPTFGGDWYINNGSHGCINMPPSKAATFYNMLAVGDPVIMHY